MQISGGTCAIRKLDTQILFLARENYNFVLTTAKFQLRRYTSQVALIKSNRFSSVRRAFLMRTYKPRVAELSQDLV